MTDGKWISVNGIVERGYAVASGQSKNNPYPQGTLDIQLPLFKDRGLDLLSYFRGTLNISISPYTFRMTNPQYTFRKVNWTPLHPPEDFSFSRCGIIFAETRYDGWVYYPHPETKIRNFQKPDIIEVIAQAIPNLQYGDKITVVINTDEISLIKSLA
ncbi:hypothetical protein ANRL3_01380 [Anaerolineae bacterium]|nr:hypothetical protein ANRL3_01380 [Anaerolineae bacterium]